MMRTINTLVFLRLTVVFGSGPRTLEFLSTGRRTAQAKLLFEQLTVFDNVTVSKCDGVTQKEQFKPCLQKIELLDRCDEARNTMWESFHTIQDYTNNSVAVVQRRRGCSRTDNGTVSFFDVWAVNGNEFLSFNPENLTWTSESHSSLQVKEIWDKLLTRNYVFRAFLKNFCSAMIERITLKSLPKHTDVWVFAKPVEHSDEAHLLCHVTTTDPSVKSVHLIGNGATRVSGFSVMGPLPSGDGLWILRLEARISLRLTHLIYGCAVQSENHNWTTYWNGTTLDGRYIYFGMAYKFLNAIIGFLAVIALILVMSCAMIALLNIIQMRRRPPAPPPPPELIEQFESFLQSATLNPEIRNILLSFLYGTNIPEGLRDAYNQWLETVELENNRDPEFYGYSRAVSPCNATNQWSVVDSSV